MQLTWAPVLALVMATTASAVESRFGPVVVRCPPGEGCEGQVSFTVVVSYDVAPVTSLITNLKIRFTATGHTESCLGSYDGGNGTLRYVTEDGRSFVFTASDLTSEEELRVGTLSPADRATLAQLQGRGCHTWTPDELAWWKGHAVPTTLNGWVPKWECQRDEQGRGGMSMTDIDAEAGVKIKQFEIFFMINVRSICHGKIRRDRVVVQVGGP